MNPQFGWSDRDAIRELAIRTQHSEEEVRDVLEDEWRAAERDARVKAFVPVFAQRRAFERLKAGGTSRKGA